MYIYIYIYIYIYTYYIFNYPVTESTELPLTIIFLLREAY